MEGERASTPRPEAARSRSWPLEPQTLILPTTKDEAIYKHTEALLNHELYCKPTHRKNFDETTYGFDFFEEDLNNNPEYHFLSPIKMYEYDSDSDDWDGEEIEWDAGITDFALFDNDRRRAQETGGALSSKWDGMLEQQSSALQRAVKRTRRGSDPLAPATLRRDEREVEEEMPSLTPDASPELKDDLDVDAFRTQTISRTDGPYFLTITVTPPSDNENESSERKGKAAPAQDFFPSFLASTRPTRSPNGKLQRPGLRHSRTMSGHIHTWQRPSMQTVGEDLEGEERAEKAELEDGYEGDDDNDEIRGRKR